MRKNTEVFEWGESEVNIEELCHYAQDRGIGLYTEIKGIVITAFPNSDPRQLILRYKCEAKIEELLMNEEFEFYPSKKHFKNLYLNAKSRAICLRLGRLLQFSLRNSRETLESLAMDLFSFLLKEQIISKDEFCEICNCLSSIWIHRVEFSEIYSSGLYEKCVSHSSKRRKK